MLPCISPQVDSLSVDQLFIKQPVELPNILDSLVSTTCAYTYVWWVGGGGEAQNNVEKFCKNC